MASAERSDAAAPAKQVVTAHRAELVIGEHVLPRKQGEILRLDQRTPTARLQADGAIAAAGSGIEVYRGLVANGAAMTTAVIGLLHALPLLTCGSIVSGL